MKQFFSILTMLLGAVVMAASPVTSDDAYKINRKDKINRDAALGSNLYSAQQFGVKAQWDVTKQGGAADSDVTLVDEDQQPVKLPANAIIKNCFLDVVSEIKYTNFADKSARIAFSSSDIGDLKALALVHTSFLHTTGTYTCSPIDATQSSWLKLESEATLKMRIGSEKLVDGLVNIWVNYALSD